MEFNSIIFSLSLLDIVCLWTCKIVAAAAVKNYLYEVTISSLTKILWNKHFPTFCFMLFSASADRQKWYLFKMWQGPIGLSPVVARNLLFTKYHYDIFLLMCESCHLDRVMNVAIDIECQMIFVIFFCSVKFILGHLQN